MSHVRGYLRASTKEQDAGRARADLERFAQGAGREVVSWYVENESGATLARPELLRLLADALPGDVLLVEQVDRLARLNAADWEDLRAKLAAKRIRVVALDLPTSHQALKPPAGDTNDAARQFEARMLDAVNSMMLDMLAAIARKDYTDRRRRQAQGIEAAKQKGAYQGRPADEKRHAAILRLLDEGKSWAEVVAITKASRSTIKRAVDARKAAEATA